MDSTTLIEVKSLAEGLGVGDSRRAVCPWCGGGDNHERSFVVRATDTGVHYTCYRATCPGENGRKGGSIGGVGVDRGFAGVSNSHKHRALNPYVGDLEPLPAGVRTFFRERFGLTNTETSSAGFRWAPEDGRVYMPVYGPSGMRRGAQLRSYKSNAKLKVVAHQETAAPWQAFYRLGTGRPDGIREPHILVVVEDQVSALKVSRHFNAVAFLGTRLTDDRVAELADIGPRKLVLALDADAQDKAIDMLSQNMLLFESIDVAFLDKDFKDTPDAEIIERVKDAMS